MAGLHPNLLYNGTTCGSTYNINVCDNKVPNSREDVLGLLAAKMLGIFGPRELGLFEIYYLNGWRRKVVETLFQCVKWRVRTGAGGFGKCAFCKFPRLL
jgi:hypothetical protein